MKQKSELKTCCLCGSGAKYVFSNKVLGKYNVSYFKCGKCELVQTENPYWLKEAYSSAIANADTGLLSRNFILSKITAGVIYFLFDKNSKHLDYAGGYGVFTRLMRDIGYDYYWDDPKSENIFAKNYEAKRNDEFQVVSAFEFLEHIRNPLIEIGDVFKKYNNKAFIFSTMLYKEPLDKRWWYFAYETGQHISFYNIKTLRFVASKLELNFYSNGVNLHMFSKNKVSSAKFVLLTRVWPIAYLWAVKKLKSKTFEDHKMVLKKDNENII